MKPVRTLAPTPCAGAKRGCGFMITGSEEAAYKKYFDMVWRVCFVMTGGSSADCEDACSDTFMRYIQQSRQNGLRIRSTRRRG